MIREASFAGEKKYFPSGDMLGQKSSAEELMGAPRFFAGVHTAVLIKADVKIAIAQTFGSIVGDEDQETLIRRDVGISVVVFGIDLVAEVLGFGVLAVHQP